MLRTHSHKVESLTSLPAATAPCCWDLDDDLDVDLDVELDV